jgi:hypothetical protein
MSQIEIVMLALVGLAAVVVLSLWVISGILSDHRDEMRRLDTNKANKA